MAKGSFPDPGVTASLYCAGRLDEVVGRTLVPFWRGEAATEAARRGSYFWFLRYPRGGPHVKIRLHGPPEQLPALRDALVSQARSFLSSMEPPLGPPAVQSRKSAPAIDVEDGTSHPDVSFLWTTYRRSPILLGGDPLLDDDRHVSLLTRTMGLASELVLKTHASGDGEALSHARRLASLQAIVASGLGALWPDPEERAAYLTYHRNWLIRWPVLASRTGSAKAEQILARYEGEFQRFDRSSSGQVDSGPAPARNENEERWHHALLELRRYLSAFSGDPSYDLDPFVSGPVFLVLFKVFHLVSNQLGLNPLNEGLAYHFLLRSAGAGGGQFQLLPA